jgi:hypothetical protein
MFCQRQWHRGKDTSKRKARTHGASVWNENTVAQLCGRELCLEGRKISCATPHSCQLTWYRQEHGKNPMSSGPSSSMHSGHSCVRMNTWKWTRRVCQAGESVQGGWMQLHRAARVHTEDAWRASIASCCHERKALKAALEKRQPMRVTHCA